MKLLDVEIVLNAFIVLYDECCNSTLRREKTIAEFIEYGQYIFNKDKQEKRHYFIVKSFASRVRRCRFN